MSKGNPQAGGSTSGFGSQNQFGSGYTQPYGAPGSGTYDPMLGFGQSSGTGTTFNYPTRYSADYTRYAQSGQPFNQPVMGYNTYGQIFAQPQRPPPTMGGKGGSKFQPQPPAGGGKGRVGSPGVPNPGQGRDRLGMPLITDLPQQPPTMGGKGGPQPKNDGVTISYPGGSRTEPRSPQRRSNQLGLTGGPGVTPPPLTGGVPNDFTGNFTPVQANRQVIDENIYNSPFGQLIAQPAQQAGGVFASNLNNPAYQQQMAFQQGNSQEATRNRIQRELNDAFATGQKSGVPLADLYKQQDELSNKLYGQYGLNPVGTATMSASRPSVEGGLGGMPTGGPQIRADYEPIGGRNFDMLPTVAPDNYIPRFGNMGYFQEGGQVPPDANMEMMMAETAQPEMAGEYDRLIQMTMQAILGQVESPDEVIQMFIDEFGVDAFRQLREAVLKQQVPNAQTEGMVDGNGGGMDDQVMGMIGNQRPVAVSPGEYIVPADVVSGLGDGSSKSGADILDELNQAVRMARTGTTQQPRPLMETMQ